MRLYCLLAKEKLHFSQDGIDRTPQSTDRQLKWIFQVKRQL